MWLYSVGVDIIVFTLYMHTARETAVGRAERFSRTRSTVQPNEDTRGQLCFSYKLKSVYVWVCVYARITAPRRLQ